MQHSDPSRWACWRIPHRDGMPFSVVKRSHPTNVSSRTPSLEEIISSYHPHVSTHVLFSFLKWSCISQPKEKKKIHLDLTLFAQRWRGRQLNSLEFQTTDVVLREQKGLVGGFPGGAVVVSLPANAGDTGSSLGLGRSHMPWSN